MTRKPNNLWIAAAAAIFACGIGTSPVSAQSSGNNASISAEQLDQILRQNQLLMKRVEQLEKKVAGMESTPIPNDFSAPISHPPSLREPADSDSSLSGKEPPILEPREEEELYFGYSLFLAKPHMKESFQATTLNAATSTLRLVPLDNNYEPSHRFWLGYAGESGLGGRVTQWNFDDSSDPLSLVSNGATSVPGATVTSVIFPATITAVLPGDTLSVRNGLKVNTTDLEGTLDLQFGYTDLRIGAGIRHADIEQTFRSSVSSGGAQVARLDWSREFEGLGPTISVDGRRRIGTGGLSALGKFRGSLLYGEKNLRRSATGSLAPIPYLNLPNGAPAFVNLTEADDFSAAFEMGIGAEWRRDLGSLGHFYLQGMYEGQLWTAAGQPTLTFLGFEGLNLNIGISKNF